MESPTKTVIHIDDDVDDRMIFKDIAEELDPSISVIHFNNGLSALRFFKDLKDEERPSLIIMDINMPLVDGKQLLKKIKQIPTLSFVPVVIFTTSASNADQLFALKENVHLFTKPHTATHFKEAIKSILEFCS